MLQEPALKYICDRFVERVRLQIKDKNGKEVPREVYPHFTEATNTQHMEFVFNVVTNLIIQWNLRNSGLI